MTAQDEPRRWSARRASGQCFRPSRPASTWSPVSRCRTGPGTVITDPSHVPYRGSTVTSACGENSSMHVPGRDVDRVGLLWLGPISSRLRSRSGVLDPVRAELAHHRSGRLEPTARFATRPRVLLDAAEVLDRDLLEVALGRLEAVRDRRSCRRCGRGGSSRSCRAATRSGFASPARLRVALEERVRPRLQLADGQRLTVDRGGDRGVAGPPGTSGSSASLQDASSSPAAIARPAAQASHACPHSIAFRSTHAGGLVDPGTRLRRGDHGVDHLAAPPQQLDVDDRLAADPGRPRPGTSIVRTWDLTMLRG